MAQALGELPWRRLFLHPGTCGTLCCSPDTSTYHLFSFYHASMAQFPRRGQTGARATTTSPSHTRSGISSRLSQPNHLGREMV